MNKQEFEQKVKRIIFNTKGKDVVQLAGELQTVINEVVLPILDDIKDFFNLQENFKQ